MKTCITYLVFLLIVCWFVPGLSAAVIDKSILPAETKWIAHFDMDNFNQTYLKKLLLENDKSTKIKKNRNKLYQEIKVDLFKDISGITIFGGPDKSIVFCCKGNLNRAYVLKRFKKEVEYQLFKHQKFDIYKWECKNYGVFVNKNMVLYSQKLQPLKDILDIKRGKKPGITSSNSILKYLKMVPDNAFFLAAAGNISSLSKYVGTKAYVLKNTGFASFLTAEDAKIINMRAILSLNDPRKAEQIGNIVRGLISLVQLKGDNEHNVISLLSKLKLKVQKNKISLSFSHPTEKVVKILLGQK